ncbi:PREDICTED: embryogenesis-associated protein EMB8-like [Tarenaya hassleriana]|uniref:embryogenesis-associated protein EMB8-like n=1 Tax=Tarenaya hassleriana TaxID=28532 RepID=UPI00053C75EF|nr:PREDICTED: embryogenesis-associated protein EMB8-like [Tarenaya hassleriana]
MKTFFLVEIRAGGPSSVPHSPVKFCGSFVGIRTMDNQPLSDSPPLSPYELLVQALSLIPVHHYVFALLLVWFVFLYNFLEFHLFEDLILGRFSGRVNLTYNPDSPVYNGVVARCRILLGRYATTPWLSSPHIQTCFLNFFGRPPVFNYRRQIFRTSDGGTIALDWLTSSDVVDDAPRKHNEIRKDDTTPIAVVVPGLSSDSSAAYLKHLAYSVAKAGWNVVVSNHRGLGGVSVTSDIFYNAGWTEDIRVIVDYLHHEYPMAPLFTIGTSVGANILVKYLGEEGEKTPVAGAVAICSPWDLLISDRFICRGLVQKLYGRALTIGLQGYAQLHEPQISRLANWEGIKKSRSIRDFDHHATIHIGNFETVDTFYRRSSSAQYVRNVSVPLLCISALDDPLCTKEAIPWDECRANKNVVLATTKHGGHLAFFQGFTAPSLWWVHATNEFLGVLSCSRYMHLPKKAKGTEVASPREPSINQGPYLNVAEDGMVAAVTYDQDAETLQLETKHSSEPKPEDVPFLHTKCSASRRFKEVSRWRSRRSTWLLGYIAVVASFPMLGFVLNYVFRKKRRSVPKLLR